MTENQWCNLTKYIYSSIVLKFIFEVLVLEYFHFTQLYASTSSYF